MGIPLTSRRLGRSRPRAFAVIVSVCVLLLTACGEDTDTGSGSTGSSEGGSLSVLYSSKSVQLVPFFYADAKGAFKGNGVDVNPSLANGQSQMSALVAGHADIAITGSPQSFGPNVQGANIVTVMVYCSVFPWKFFAQPEIESVEELKGKKVAIASKGDTFDVGLRAALPKLGLSPDEITYISVGSQTEVTAAVINGAVDGAALIDGQYTHEAEQKGLRELFDFAQLGLPAPVASVMVTRKTLEEKRPQVQAFVTSMVEGLIQLRKDEAGALPVMQELTGLKDKAALKSYYDYYVKNVWNYSPSPTAEQFNTVIEAALPIRPELGELDIEDQFDASLVEEALKDHPWD